MISAVGELHEALIAQRRTFLENAEARTYQRAKELPPLPLDIQHPAEQYDEFLWPCTQFLPNMNREVEQIRKDLEGPNDRYTRVMKKKYPAPPSLWTAKTVSTELIKHWGYDGKGWVVSDYAFESFFPEDEGQKVVETHWFIPGVKESSAIEHEAVNARPLVGPAIKKIEKLPSVSHHEDLRGKVLLAIHGNNPQWQPGVVDWRHLKLMDEAIRNLAGLARELGDGPFLSFVTPAEFDRLIIDAQNLRLLWRGQRTIIGENQRFWLLYALGEYHKEWIPLKRLASLARSEDSEDSLKQVIYHLKKNDLGNKPWSQVAAAIESGKKVYRLNLTQGVRLVPR